MISNDGERLKALEKEIKKLSKHIDSNKEQEIIEMANGGIFNPDDFWEDYFGQWGEEFFTERQIKLCENIIKIMTELLEKGEQYVSRNQN